MADATICLSDAAKAVVDRTLTRLKDSFRQEQVTGLGQLAADGRLFDVEALVALADLTSQSSEVANGN